MGSYHHINYISLVTSCRFSVTSWDRLKLDILAGESTFCGTVLTFLPRWTFLIWFSTRVRTCGWRLPDSSLATRLKPWLPRPSATYRSPSAFTSERLSSRQTSEPRNESSGRVRLLFNSSEEKESGNSICSWCFLPLCCTQSLSDEAIVLEINVAVMLLWGLCALTLILLPKGRH